MWTPRRSAWRGIRCCAVFVEYCLVWSKGPEARQFLGRLATVWACVAWAACGGGSHPADTTGDGPGAADAGWEQRQPSLFDSANDRAERVAAGDDLTPEDLGPDDLAAGNIADVVLDDCTAQSIVPIALGNDHTCRVSEGVVWCWGHNSAGQLGNGTWQDSHLPVKVDMPMEVLALSAGIAHTCALAVDGTVWCWGNDDDGQIGTETCGGSVSTPMQVSNIDSVIALTAGIEHTCVLRTGGVLSCWGLNQYAQLGIGGVAGFIPYAACSPVSVVGLAHVTLFSAAGIATCALSNCGELWCWGGNVISSKNYGSADIGGSTPAFIAIVQQTRSLVGTCLITDGGEVYCWERTPVYDEEALLDGATPWDTAVPTLVPELQDVATVTDGGSYVLQKNGTVWCWKCAANSRYGIDEERIAPWQVNGLEKVEFLLSGAGHTCAIVEDGGTWCWGNNDHGQLGDGTTEQRAVPTLVRLDEE